MPATSYETGTATDYVDLFNKIRDFLTTDATLVAASEEWTQLQGPVGTLVAGDAVFLEGPGLSGTDSVYCGISTFTNSGSDIYNIHIWGNGGYDSNETATTQPLKSGVKNLACRNGAMDYWISANGRHWKCAVTVSTAQSFCYVGLGLPVGAISSQYPYPFVIHGSVRGNVRFSDTDARSSFAIHPGYNTTELYYPDNQWRLISNTLNVDNSSLNWGGATYPGYAYPRCGHDQTPTMSSPDVSQIYASLDPNFDDSYLLQRCVYYSGTSGPYVGPMCYLDGVYAISGRNGVSAEDTITISSVDYLVVQNQTRSGVNDFMAMELG